MKVLDDILIDPGVRRFVTTDCPEGTATIDGNNALDHLSRRLDRTRTTLVRSIQKRPESRFKGQSRTQKGSRRTRLSRSKRQ